MRDTLLVFILSVQEAVKNDGFKEQFILRSGGTEGPSLWFGYGYYPSGKVLYWYPRVESQTEVVMENEAGVDKYLEYFTRS